MRQNIGEVKPFMAYKSWLHRKHQFEYISESLPEEILGLGFPQEGQ